MMASFRISFVSYIIYLFAMRVWVLAYYLNSQPANGEVEGEAEDGEAPQLALELPAVLYLGLAYTELTHTYIDSLHKIK